MQFPKISQETIVLDDYIGKHYGLEIQYISHIDSWQKGSSDVYLERLK